MYLLFFYFYCTRNYEIWIYEIIFMWNYRKVEIEELSVYSSVITKGLIQEKAIWKFYVEFKPTYIVFIMTKFTIKLDFAFDYRLQYDNSVIFMEKEAI